MKHCHHRYYYFHARASPCRGTPSPLAPPQRSTAAARELLAALGPASIGLAYLDARHDEAGVHADPQTTTSSNF